MKSLKLNIDKLEKQKWLWFIIFSILSVILIYIINNIIITDPKYFTGGNDNSVKLFRNVYKAIYIIYPFYSFFRIIIISFFIKLAFSYFKLEKVKLMKLFTLVLIAEYVFLIPDLIEIIWFLFIHTKYTMKEVDLFFPLSLFSLIKNHGISSAYTFPIKLINLFEIAYWIILVLGVREITGKNTKYSIKVIATSYGLILLIIIVIRFIIFSLILQQ